MGDTIRNPKLLDAEGGLMRFDIVTANPPFSLDRWGYDDVGKDPYERFARGMPPKTKGDYAFILHMLKTLGMPSPINTGADGRSGAARRVVSWQ